MHAPQPTIGVPSFLPRTPRDAVDMLRRQAFLLAGVFATIVFLTGLGAWLAPRTYRSEAKLFVRVGRESVALDPTATTGQIISVYESRENELNSVLDVLRSRVILEDVLADVGFETLLPRTPDTPAAREAAIRTLEDAIAVTQTKKSGVVTVTTKARTPELAQRIARATLDAFHVRHVQAYRTEGSFEFFRNQEQLQQTRLTDASRRLGQLKNELQLTSVDGQRKSLQDRLALTESALQSARAEHAASAAAVQTLERQIAAVPTRIVSSRTDGFPNAPADTARQQLLALRNRERELLAQYTELHPLVVAVRSQIVETEAAVRAQETARAQETSVPHPTRQHLEVALLSERAKLAAAQARTTSLAEEHGRLLGELHVLNSREAEVDRLQREVELAQVAYKGYAERAEQSRIDQELGERRISNVNVVQPPSLEVKAVAPKSRTILFLGCVAGALTALGVGLAREYAADRRTAGTKSTTSRSRTTPSNSDRHEHRSSLADALAT